MATPVVILSLVLRCGDDAGTDGDAVTRKGCGDTRVHTRLIVLDAHEGFPHLSYPMYTQFLVSHFTRTRGFTRKFSIYFTGGVQ